VQTFKVLKCFDARFCPIDGKPYLYFDTNLKNGKDQPWPVDRPIDEHPVCLQLYRGCHAHGLDRRVVPPFGPAQLCKQISHCDWFWNDCRPFLVIIIPFYKGRHYAKHPCEFLPVVRFLQTLHESGKVHGDIRSLNMLFNGNVDWVMIDFDFGGKVEARVPEEILLAVYPSGYQASLPDGSRIGEPKDPVLPLHDWLALLHIMTCLHEFKHPGHAGIGAEFKSTLNQHFDASFPELATPAPDTSIEESVNHLVGCLEGIRDNDSWKTEYHPVFLVRIVMASERNQSTGYGESE
jgi:hypothetical protein